MRRLPLTKSPGQPLSEFLLCDLERMGGLMPLFGSAQTPAMREERLKAERQLAGTRLQRIEALLQCLLSDYSAYDAGRVTKDQLIEETWGILRVMDAETRYDEEGMLTALYEVTEKTGAQ